MIWRDGVLEVARRWSERDEDEMDVRGESKSENLEPEGEDDVEVDR